MSNNQVRGISQDHTLNGKGTNDIRKGLQRIKQAQIEVLRQLRKDDGDASRNYSLTYSKETAADSRPTLKFDGDAAVLKQKLDKMQLEITEFTARDSKLRKQYNGLAEENRKLKETSSKAQLKMRQYQKGEERALAKAQQALANAITSQKKYIAMKSQYDKINKDRQRLIAESKRLQAKSLTDLLNNHEIQAHIPNKIVKELKATNQTVLDLIREINGHRCSKKQSQSGNSLTINTLDAQHKVDKHINNIIAYLTGLQNFIAINGPVQSGYGFESNHLLSISFRDDIRKIEQQLDQDSKQKTQKIAQLQLTNNQMQKKMKKLQAQLKETQQQLSTLRSRVKMLSIQVEDGKISRQIIQEQYEKYVLQSKQKLKMKQDQVRILKNKEQQKTTNRDRQDNNVNSVEQQKSYAKTLSQFSTKNEQLQKQNTNLQQKLKNCELKQKSLKQVTESLKNQIDSIMGLKQHTELQLKYQINRLTARILAQGGIQARNQLQWDQLVRVVSRMQEERQELLAKEKQLKGRIDSQANLHREQINVLQGQLKDVRNIIQDLRKESSAASYDQTDLARLRNQQLSNTQQPNAYNETVDRLWNKKQGQYSNVNGILQQIKHKEQQQQQPHFRTVTQPQLINPFYNNPNQVSIMQYHDLSSRPIITNHAIQHPPSRIGGGGYQPVQYMQPQVYQSYQPINVFHQGYMSR